MKKLILALSLLSVSPLALSATVYCNGVVDDIHVNNSGQVFIGLNTAFDGVRVPTVAAPQALELALLSLNTNKTVRITAFSDSNDRRCRDNNETLQFRNIRITD